ncbi:hypothetical protein H7K45_24880 [Mycobacterium yunnanensis]|uniref:Uncharacterized protein n=1 Tax=Mycobacterium yunnanensis TaxID=368477 RepID=A0A9X2Z6W5_9MYCO|nr:hypothetical protein [Mycobacterium yunnanensis]MCV7423794.1 hypothetical protein [Mycobacterium yunnanensis]
MSSPGAVGVTDLSVRRRRRANESVTAALIDATVGWLRESSLDAVTVGAVAERAGISPVVADELFGSIDELILETCLSRLSAVALSDEADQGSLARVAEQLGRMMIAVADEPAIASACAAVYLHAGTAAARAQERIGLEIHRLITSAMGPGCWPEVITTLEFIFSGALIQAAMGTMSFEKAAEGVETAVSLILDGPPRR